MKKKEPLVNIIIITTNKFDFIGDCVKSVLKGNYKNIKLFLVDNNSEKQQYLNFYNQHKNIKNVSFLRLKKNNGFAAGCNQALKKIKNGYIVFLNDDTIVSKNWLNPVINYMENNQDVGACQPKIKDMNKKDYFEYAGAGGGFMDVYGFPFCRGRVFFTNEKDKGQYDDQIDVVWTSGNCMITRAKIMKKVGLMDEIFFIYGEEADLCWRMHYFGYRLVYVPSSVVYHYGSGTMGKPSSRKVFLHHRNGLILMLKNYSPSELVRYLPFRILLDGVAVAYYLLGNKLPSNSIAVVRAYLSLFKLLPTVLKKRKQCLPRVKKNKMPYPLYKKSIILDYFLFNKKFYHQLKYSQNSN